MKRVKELTNRIAVMLMFGMLIVGAIPGTVLASENRTEIGQTSEMAAEVPEGTTTEEVSGEMYGEETVAQEEAEVQYYTVTLDANGGYFENGWDDALQETVEQAEVLTKYIPVGETVSAVPVYNQENVAASFLGWSLERDGEIAALEQEEYAPVDHCTLYAVWEYESLTSDVVVNNDNTDETKESDDVVEDAAPEAEMVKDIEPGSLDGTETDGTETDGTETDGTETDALADGTAEGIVTDAAVDGTVTDAVAEGTADDAAVDDASEEYVEEETAAEDSFVIEEDALASYDEASVANEGSTDIVSEDALASYDEASVVNEGSADIVSEDAIASYDEASVANEGSTDIVSEDVGQGEAADTLKAAGPDVSEKISKDSSGIKVPETNEIIDAEAPDEQEEAISEAVSSLDEYSSSVVGFWGGHKYQIFEENVSPVEAQEICSDMGGYLATITSAEEQAFIGKLADWGDVGTYSFVCEWDYGDGTLDGHIYKRFDEFKTWTNAANYCESLGGHLVTITSAGENNVVSGLSRSGGKNAYWIGAKLDTNGKAGWVTREPLSYANWANKEPDNYQAKQGYIFLFGKDYKSSGFYFGQWGDMAENGVSWNNDSFWGSSKFGFVCEWETRQLIAKARVTGVTDKTFTEKVKTNGAGQAVTVTLGNKTLVKNTDYKVTYKNHKEVGTATVVITGIGGYSGTISKTYKIKLAVPSIQSLKSDIHGEFTCTGSSIYGATSYKVYYKNLSTKESGTKENTGRTVTATGLKAGDTYEVRIQAQRKVGSKLLTGKYSEPKNVKIHKASKSITGYTIWISGEKNNNDKYYSYTGSAIKPGIELKKLTKKLRSGVDYKVTYSNNTNQGKATVQIKGIGDYYGTLNATFYIHTFVKKSGKWYYRGGRFEKKAYDLDGPLIVEQAMAVPGAASVTCTRLTANESVSVHTNTGITSKGDVETNQAVELSKKASFTCMGKYTVKSRLTLSENAAISVEKGMSVLTVGYLQMSRGSSIDIKESFVFNPSSSSAPVTDLSGVYRDGPFVSVPLFMSV